MKKYIIVLASLLYSSVIFSQDQNPADYRFINPNSVQLEAGGHGLFYSLNYERVLINRNRFKTTAQLGVSYYPASTGVRDVWLPVSINEIVSFGNHHLEIGLGMVPIREALRDSENIATEWYWSGMVSGRIGYRYQKPDGQFLLRAGFTPLAEVNGLDPTIRFIRKRIEFHPLAGISVGYAF